MENTGLFPNMVNQMIAVGEESGSLDEMSAKVATFYEAEVDNAVDAMSEPARAHVMVILGVLVGSLVIAMYLPISSSDRWSDKRTSARGFAKRRAPRDHVSDRAARVLARRVRRQLPGAGSGRGQLPERRDLIDCRHARARVARASAASSAAKRRAPRWPAAEPQRFNLAVPRSACRRARHRSARCRNIPLISWLVLRGRCAHCGQPISVRYPLVEALSGGFCAAAVAWKFGFGWPALAALVLTWFLIALTFIDVDHQLLPDGLTLPLLWARSARQSVGTAARGCPAGGRALEPHRGDGGLREPVERLSSLPAAHR